MVTHQLQVERRIGKVRQSETDVLPLCHATNWADSVGFWRGCFFDYPKSCCKKIRVGLPPKNVLSYGTLPHTVGFENFATAMRWYGHQNSSTVERVDVSGAARGKGGSFPPMGGRPKIM